MGGWGEGGRGGERRETRRTRKEGNCHFCFFSLASFPSLFPKHANSTEINNKHTYQVSVVKSTGSLFTSSGAKGKKIKTELFKFAKSRLLYRGFTNAS